MNKAERLANIIGNISDEMIKQSAQVDDKSKFDNLGKGKKIAWIRWTAVAACIALFIGVGFIGFGANKPTTDAELPMITLDIEGFYGGGMGFEGYMAYDISELRNDNPWTKELSLTHLPVYENMHAYNKHYIVPDPDIEKMKSYLIDIEERLGMDTENLEIGDDRPSEQEKKEITEKYDGDVPEGWFDIKRVFVEDEDKGIEVEVDSSFTVTVYFDPPIPLPEEYNFNYYVPYEDIALVADYLKDEYKGFINMENPKANIYGGDYNIYAQQNFDISFFEQKGEIVEQIINYNFKEVTFACDDDGKLFLARVYRPDLSRKIGDYPIIAPDEAEELLSKGHYITSVPEQFPGEEYIKKTELIYRTSGTDKIYLPYYRIYVEMPTMQRENGLNTYGAYYVPAIEGKYIENMPLWDGSIN